MQLSSKHFELMHAIMQCDGVADAAKAVGVATKTAYRWLRDPVFVAELQQARRQAVEQSMMKLQGATGSAAAVMLEIMNDTELSPTIRLRAAQSVLDASLKWVEIDDLASRLEALEAVTR